LIRKKNTMHHKIVLSTIIILIASFGYGQNKVENGIVNFLDSIIGVNKNLVFGEYHNDSNTYLHYSSIKYLNSDCNIFFEDNLYVNVLKELYLFDGDTLFITYLRENANGGNNMHLFLLSLVSDTNVRAKELLKRIYFFDVNFLKFKSPYSYILERIIFPNIFNEGLKGEKIISSSFYKYKYTFNRKKEDFVRINKYALLSYRSFNEERKNCSKYARVHPLLLKFKATYRDKIMYKNYLDLKGIVNNEKKDIIFTGNYHVERNNKQNERVLYNNEKFSNALDSNYILIKSFSLPIHEGNKLEYKTYKGAQTILNCNKNISEPSFYNVSKNVGAFDYLYVYPWVNK